MITNEPNHAAFSFFRPELVRVAWIEAGATIPLFHHRAARFSVLCAKACLRTDTGGLYFGSVNSVPRILQMSTSVAGVT